MVLIKDHPAIHEQLRAAGAEIVFERAIGLVSQLISLGVVTVKPAGAEKAHDVPAELLPPPKTAWPTCGSWKPPSTRPGRTDDIPDSRPPVVRDTCCDRDPSRSGLARLVRDQPASFRDQSSSDRCPPDVSQALHQPRSRRDSTAQRGAGSAGGTLGWRPCQSPKP